MSEATENAKNQGLGDAPHVTAAVHLFAVGFVTLLAQVVLLREVLVASFGSELIYILAMGVQMIGTAIGALAGRRCRTTDALFIAFAALVPLLLVVARALRLIFRATPGAYMSFPQQMMGIALVLIPCGAAGGLLFTSAARRYVGGAGTLAAAYAIESVGGLAGGVVSTALIALRVQNLAAALICGVVAAGAALFGRRVTRMAAAALVLLLAAALFSSPPLDRRLTALNHPQLLATRDTPYGRVTVTGTLGQIVVFTNDALAFESEGTSAEEFVHLAALQVEEPRSVLLLGGSVEGLASEVLKHRPAEVRSVEVDAQLVQLARSYLPAAAGALTIEEPRRFLERTGRYDLILSGMPEPDSGQASRFYTSEFFAMCARRLAPGGVFAFRLRSSENLWTPALALRTASIVRALRFAFADVIVLPGSVNVVIASNRPLIRDPGVLSRRFEERLIKARLVSAPYIRYVYTNDRLAEIERILARTTAQASTDARPACYQYTLVLWLSRFFPSLALVTGGLSGGDTARRLLVTAVLLAMLAFACRRSLALRRIALVGFAGFAGIVLESTLILAYQIREGVLYRDLGILLATFMAGLAAGSWTIGRRRQATERMDRWTGAALLLATALVACLTAWRISQTSGDLVSSGIALFAAGFVTGAIFAWASLHRVEEQAGIVGPLYAADLAGGVAGSLAASLFLIPLAGLPPSLLLVGALAVIFLFLV